MANRLVSSFVATMIMLTLATGAIWALQTNSERIAISDLKQKLDNGEKLLLIDVREDWELEEWCRVASPFLLAYAGGIDFQSDLQLNDLLICQINHIYRVIFNKIRN